MNCDLWYGFGFSCGVLLGIGLTRKYYREKENE